MNASQIEAEIQHQIDNYDLSLDQAVDNVADITGRDREEVMDIFWNERG